MKIIAEKEGLYNNDIFVEYISKEDIVDGIMFQITITSDGKVILFNSVRNNYASLGQIQTSTINELKNQSIVLIDDILEKLKDYPKKIYLELVPFDALVVTDKNYEQISKFYQAFVNNVLEVLKKHSNLDIRLCSINQSILYHLMNSNSKYKIGMIFEPQNLNYVDVDFYIFVYTNFNNTIINQLLDANKDVMIQIDDSNNIPTIFEHISKNSNPNRLINNISIITSRPILIADYIKENTKRV